VKLSNNPALVGAEAVEERGPGKGNATGETRPGRRAGLSVSSELDRVRQVARKDKDARFTALCTTSLSTAWRRRIGRSVRARLRG
jgi:RNA-directed DNA polymerase